MPKQTVESNQFITLNRLFHLNIIKYNIVIIQRSAMCFLLQSTIFT